MAIKPIMLSAFRSAIKIIGKIQTPIRSLESSKDVFIKSQSDTVKLENQILQLKNSISKHQKNYSSLKNKLDTTFGDDWIFCYSDLTDKQSDMYIECIEEKAQIAQCRAKIEMLSKKLYKTADDSIMNQCL